MSTADQASGSPRFVRHQPGFRQRSSFFDPRPRLASTARTGCCPEEAPHRPGNESAPSSDCERSSAPCEDHSWATRLAPSDRPPHRARLASDPTPASAALDETPITLRRSATAPALPIPDRTATRTSPSTSCDRPDSPSRFQTSDEHEHCTQRARSHRRSPQQSRRTRANSHPESCRDSSSKNNSGPSR